MKFIKNPVIVFVVFLIIGLGIYANSFVNEFIWDDYDVVVNNTYIKDWRNLSKFFTENLIAGVGQTTNYYRPILLISFAFDYHIWGLDSFGFHLTNTLLHILVAWLGFMVFSRLIALIKDNKSLYLLSAFLASLFFLIHPVQTEAVTYIAGRADSLSSVFCLISIWFFISFRKHASKKNFLLVLLFFILGLLTKEQSILLPGLLLLVDWIFFSKKLSKLELLQLLKRHYLFFAISIAYLILHFTVLNFKGDMSFDYNNELYDANIFVRLFTFSSVALSYFKIIFIPTGLHMAREISLVSSFFSKEVFLFLSLMVISFFLLIKTWRRTSLVSFGFLWFVIILLPRTNIFAINRPMYEHWLYLPMLGFWFAFFITISFLTKYLSNYRIEKSIKGLLIALLMMTIVVFSFLTIDRNNDWKNPIIFYENNLEYTPNSIIQHNNLGMAYSEAGRYVDALLEYQKAIEIDDSFPQVHHNMANLLLINNDIKGAIGEYERAIAISPGFSVSYLKLYDLYVNINNIDEANKIRERYNRKFVND